MLLLLRAVPCLAGVRCFLGRDALPKSLPLFVLVAGCLRLHLFMVCDVCGPDTLEGRLKLIDDAAAKGVHIMLRDGVEYLVGGNPLPALAGPSTSSALQQVPAPSFWFDLRTGRVVHHTGSGL